MKTKKIIQKASLVCCIIFGSVALSNAQEPVIYYWDFNSISHSPVGGDSLGTAFSYANTLHVDSMNKTLPLWANFSRKGAQVAKILYTRPSGNGTLINETTTGQEGGLTSPCTDSVLVGSHYYHGIQYNGNLYPECPWVNVKNLLGNDTGPGSFVPYLGSTAADEDNEEAGNYFIKAQNPAVGSYMTFYMPTTNYKNIIFSFALSTSSTSDLPYSILSYTDDGVTWKNLTRAMDTFNLSGAPTPDTILVNNYITGNSFWELRTINFTSDPATNNNAHFAVRWTYAGAAAGHNTRYDNFSLQGDSGSLDVNEVASVNSNVKVFPNPNNGKFMIAFTNPETSSGTQTIEVYNVLGKNIYTTKLNATNTQIDLSNNAAGVYLYRVITESGSLIGEGKLVIQK